MTADSAAHNSEHSVLVAEDDVISRRLLTRFLEGWGYDVTLAEDGKQALQHIEENGVPPLVLLDWQMPEVSGLELCRILKSKYEEKFCYVIMITGKSEVSDAVEAFESGADDLVAKPFDKKFLQARLAAADRIIRYEVELQVERKYFEMHAQQMETLAQERAKQLVHADRLVTLGTMSAGIAHEINNPTAFISGNIQVLEKFWTEIEQAIAFSLEQEQGEAQKLNFIKDEVPRLLDEMKNGVARISAIVKGLKRYSRSGGEGGDRKRTDIAELLERTLQMTDAKLKGKVDVETCFEDGVPELVLDPVQIEQVIINLIVNAVDAMEKSDSPKLRLGATCENETVIITVEDFGPGIPAGLLDRIWTPFFTTKEVDKGTGLGLHICKDIILGHDGDIHVENKETGGAKFAITLPVKGTGVEAVVPQEENG